MRRFLGIFLMGMLSLGIANAKDYSSLSGPELIKLAGKVPAEDALELRAAVHKHVESLKTAKAKNSFKWKFKQAAEAHFKKMKKKDFVAMREEVRKEFEEATKEHSPDELKGMGLAGVHVCKGEVRKVWCASKKKKGAHKGGAHKEGKAHGHHEGGHKGMEKSKGESMDHMDHEDKEMPKAPAKAPAKSGGAEEQAPKSEAQHQ
ncbi:hypothetical protein NHP200010_14260 [Helicobacter bizzozeronii]|uniref:DUF1104 domain-containing protein n=1 Tax=Helicobacter bizzozeronii TaxID=56877 RepID=UPI00244D9377|nr:DUF1104 domain-containing protein [Helicobacter bizzozeronii]GMB93699.1 hypothetical protein NHP200010_14260 [Helicobacter bizzozeronii]